MIIRTLCDAGQIIELEISSIVNKDVEHSARAS